MPTSEERYPYPDPTGDDVSDQASRERIDAERAEYDRLDPHERAGHEAARALTARGFTTDDGNVFTHPDGGRVRIVEGE